METESGEVDGHPVDVVREDGGNNNRGYEGGKETEERCLGSVTTRRHKAIPSMHYTVEPHYYGHS